MNFAVKKQLLIGKIYDIGCFLLSNQGGHRMNPKRILWAIVPMVLLPYLALLMLFAVFFSTRQPWLAWVMETLFFNNAWYLIAVLLLYCLLTVIIQIVVFTAVMRRRCDALSLAKGAVLLKLFQAPAYILILIAGILLSLPYLPSRLRSDCFCWIA